MRDQDPMDGRRKTLTITALGRNILCAAKENSSAARQRQLSPFSLGEAKEFMRLLGQFVERLENGVVE